MLPVFTTGQVNDGIDHGDLLIDLSDYMKKKEGATKNELDTLTAIVANKLDATPQHKHDIEDIKQLQFKIDSKLDKGERYSYKDIISDIEEVPFIKEPQVHKLDITATEGTSGYIFYVDSLSGDLMITLNDVLIASYSIAAGKWSFETDTSTIETSIATNQTKITTLESALNEYVAKTDAVLKNHYDAILLLCQKHGMVDGDGDGASNITPTDD